MFITLQRSCDNETIRLNPNRVAFFYCITAHEHTCIQFSGLSGDAVFVKETPKEIESKIRELSRARISNYKPL